MYELTDFSLTELRELAAAVNDRIENKKKHVEQIDHWFREEPGVTRSSLVSKAKKGLPELREMNVRILTALSIVKNRETIASN